MKKNLLFILSVLLFGTGVFAQVGINMDNSPPDPSAMLDVKSTAKGAQLPRFPKPKVIASLTAYLDHLIFHSETSRSGIANGKLSPTTCSRSLYEQLADHRPGV